MSDPHTLERPKGLLTGSASGGQPAGSPDIEAARPGAPEVFGGGNATEAARLVFPAGDKSDEVRLVQIEVSPPARESLHYRATIELGEGAEAKVLVRFAGSSAGIAVPPRPILLTTALEIRLAAHSRLKLYVVSELSVPYFREAFDRAVLQEGAKLEWTMIGFDENNGIYSANIDLSGAESELDLAGAYGAHRNTEQEHIISVHHSAPRTRSRTNLKSALKDSAHLIFRGLIHVEATARGTDAYLSDRNLILEDGARAESLPQLKIETDDVACSHGATTGGPREEALFYLMSRGLDRDAAKNMLVLGHLGSVFSRLPADLAEEMEGAAASSLGIGDERSCP